MKLCLKARNIREQVWTTRITNVIINNNDNNNNDSNKW